VDTHGRESLALYPNPASDHVTLTCDEPVRMVVIRNADGRTVYEGTFGTEQVTIPVNKLCSGVYTITIQTMNGTVTRKFIKL
jgi:hypothetical protein